MPLLQVYFTRLILIPALSIAFFYPQKGQAQTNLTHYVQPLSGTAASTTLSAQKHSEGGTEQFANTIPAVGVPFGMTQFTPQTQLTETKCRPPYLYKDSVLSGFRASHWLSGSCTQDYGSLTLMPITGKLKTVAADFAASFSHRNEQTTPYLYKVSLPKYALDVAMTATTRCGFLQIIAQKTDSLYLLISPNSDEEKGYVKIDAKKSIVYGYNPVHRIYQSWGEPAGFSGYFVIKIDKAFSKKGTFYDGKISAVDSLINRKNLGGWLGFAVKKGEKISIKIGTSFSSLAGAMKNLEAEIPAWDFDKTVLATKNTWQKELSKITVGTAKEKDKRIFYTAFYHALQHPRLYDDVDGTYPQFAGNYQNKHISAGHYYDDFSMWDIYRAQLPLHEIINPKLTNDLVRSLILKGEQGGWLPIFPCWNSYTSAMIGDHSTAFIASAYNKGIRNYDVQSAYKLMRRNAFEVAGEKDYKNGLGRRAMDSYLKYGYIPIEDSVPLAFHKKEQVSRTLEYSYDDYALATIAKDLGKKDDYAKLILRAKNYQHVFDAKTSMVRGRYADGKWYPPFNPDRREPYITEGTPRQYTFYVPQDIPGLAGLMGGKKKLENALDSLFQKNEYWHGNEPGHQIPFLYNFTASPWKTQERVRQIIADEYTDGPGGLSGNDDAGQMSAWYVFASMGLYPADPVSGQYLISSPIFDDIRIRLEGKKTFRILVHKSSPEARYISLKKLNGKVFSQNFITHKDLIKGGVMEVWLGEKR